jgi:subtilisin-like proprotein convertase family protein
MLPGSSRLMPLAQLHAVSMETLLGQTIAGVWTLRVADLVPGDTDTLDRWRLSARPAPA